MKKIILFLIFLLIVNTSSCTYCEELAQDKTSNIESADVKASVFTPKTEREIKAHIANIYGEENLQNIYDKVYEIAQNAINNRSLDLKRDDFKRNSDWYKDEIIYMFYVDQFGTVASEKSNQFKDTENMLDYLKDLGVTTLYMLPFADSPMEDSGFDVKNPTDIRKDLGGKEQFETFIKKAKEQGFKIKADLVLNHFSEQHEWFQDILNGDESKINYFIATETMPEYQKYVDEKLGHIVEYKEDDGSVSKRRLIFPEISENHYRKVQVNGKDYYFYHTFYPFQLDINWKNPEVLYYNLETLNYWANLGVDIFRLDAIPYLITSIPGLIFCFTMPIAYKNTFYDIPPLLQIPMHLTVGRVHNVPAWFIPMIVIFFICSWILLKLEKKGILYKLLPILFLVTIFLPRVSPEYSDLINLSYLNRYLAYVNYVLMGFVHFLSLYIFGMYCSANKGIIDKFYDKRFLLWTGMLITSGLNIYLLFGIKYLLLKINKNTNTRMFIGV